MNDRLSWTLLAVQGTGIRGRRCLGPSHPFLKLVEVISVGVVEISLRSQEYCILPDTALCSLFYSLN